MTQKLRERIARFLGDEFVGGWDAECDAIERKALLKNADEILRAYKEAGGVFLDPDQSLPTMITLEGEIKTDDPCNLACHNIERKLTVETMLEANFKKIKEIEID